VRLESVSCNAPQGVIKNWENFAGLLYNSVALTLSLNWFKKLLNVLLIYIKLVKAIVYVIYVHKITHHCRYLIVLILLIITHKIADITASI